MFSSRLLLLSATPSGASLALPTVIATLSLSVCAPPLPLPPRSLVVMVSWALPANSVAGSEAHSVQRGVDGGERAGEGHGSIARAVTAGEGQPGGAWRA